MSENSISNLDMEQKLKKFCEWLTVSELKSLLSCDAITCVCKVESFFDYDDDNRAEALKELVGEAIAYSRYLANNRREDFSYGVLRDMIVEHYGNLYACFLQSELEKYAENFREINIRDNQS